MHYFLSVSNALCKSNKLDLPGLTDSEGQKPGVQPVISNSLQAGWQLHVVQHQRYCLVLAMQSYSRYLMAIPYLLKPSWETIEQDFTQQWLEHALGWLEAGGFIRKPEHIESVIQQFQAMENHQYYRNLDPSINGHLIDAQHWLHEYQDTYKPKTFNDEHAWQFAHIVNQQPKRINKQRRKGQEFTAIDRFIDDSLHRFAKGLCDMPIPGEKMGNFPNPFRKSPELRSVK